MKGFEYGVFNYSYSYSSFTRTDPKQKGSIKNKRHLSNLIRCFSTTFLDWETSSNAKN